MFFASASSDSVVNNLQQTGQGEKFSFGELLEHVEDSRFIELPGLHIELPTFKPLQLGPMAIDLSPTKHVVFLLVAAIILVVVAIMAVQKYKKSTIPHGLTNMMEIVVLFIRDEIAIPGMGQYGVKYVPFLSTTFFFILLMNIAGLIPYGATPTGNLAVTAGLALIAFIMIQVSSIRKDGIVHYLAHLTGGVHWALWPIMVPVEILSLFTKPFALCMRLFANMNSGHIVIISLIGLIFLFKSIIIVPISVTFALAIYMLELFVAFLQAYVFTMLTALFMGLGMEPEEEEHTH
ncbi:MAG TPA: F0F1 ATP synthase subunit A [Bacteroidota bacterium]|jgi:F-type H+-transporting ATPase subunit a|nr:F0F1 ATP synthase subunit A [Bacteroidota bacterium]